ncbi:tyrosine-type recombinase/integrase [Butyrivibrio sp. INlla21]|uniref:tyrosine-type recombinase/integrase n=1 Tax=Butyrivibrio sp. INlla21 TaxID=1520811 RepID=UPI0008EEBFB9|nr:site-specific integrase [Butyrivibrio sp. INlla21]SFU58032.1 Site-specific recombinase XerD [Butyrivibrio sp. INlla21]
MAGKRKNGEGSWSKVKVNGYLYFCYRKDGKATYGKSEKEVRAKLKEKERKAKETTVVYDSKLTVGEYVKDWLYKKKYLEVGLTLESTTFDGYEAALQTRLFGYPLADLQLSAIDKTVLQKYLKELAKKYSRESIKKTWQVLTMCLTDDEYAHYELVPVVNYKKIRIPSESNVAVKKKKVQFTSVEERDLLYNEALRKTGNGKYFYGNAARLLAFIMYSGLREGEAAGLRWSDIDIKNRLVTISQTYTQIWNRDEYGQRIGREHINKDPKSEASAATIPYKKKAGDVIDIMNEMYPQHKKNDYVFLSANGTPLTKRHILHTLKRMLKHTGLEEKDYSVHDLRHGYGSILLKEGADITTISRLLRHEEISTTADIYIGTTPDDLKILLDRTEKDD